MMLGMAKRKHAPKPKPPATWPERLKALRAKLGLNQTELAKRLRLSQSQVASFETGHREPTRPIAYLIELLENEKI